MNPTDRKSAFLNVLAANLDGSIQQEIMRFWEEKYASRPQFGVSAFLDELYSKYPISIKKGQLFRQLSRATMKLDSDPLATQSDHVRGATADDMIDRNGLVVFQHLQNEFLALAKPADRLKITNAQLDGMQQHSPAAATPVLNWLRHGKTALPEQLPLTVLKKLFNLAYVEICHLYGPVKADQMLNAALQKTNAIAEAHIVPPVNFI